MASKPTIYGFDDAGCKWETVHKADAPAIHAIEPTIDVNLQNGQITLSCSSDKFNGVKSGDLVVLSLFKSSVNLDTTKGYERINLNINGLSLSSTAPYFGYYRYYNNSSRWIYEYFNIPWATNMNIATFSGSIFEIHATIIGVAI